MLIFAELIGSSIGIGARMGLAQATFHMESVIAWTVLLIVMNLRRRAPSGCWSDICCAGATKPRAIDPKRSKRISGGNK